MDIFWWVLMLICTAPIWLPCLAIIVVGVLAFFVAAIESWKYR